MRGELAAIAMEARILLERERAKGRRRMASPASRNGAPPLAAPPATAAAAEVLALPGFESLVPRPPSAPSSPSAIPASKPLAPRDDLPQDLEAIRALVAACTKCGLCETRTRTVFADGDARARLMFVGEAPGRDEDAQGVPFVGRAGQLLNKMIAAIEMKREEVYICNVLKCRPPDNRVPAADEVERCRPYLEQQVAIVRPAVICALGLSAAQALLETKATMSSMRGKTFQYRGVPLIPTYHPAALLRNPSLKNEAWVDLQRVRDLVRERTSA
ncbi:MAG TPA: uracil-DNA glycosylase [Candidatus Eisenbacteria bacterium]